MKKSEKADTKSLLTSDDIKKLESYHDGDDHSGYFYKMLNCLKEIIISGIEENKFTHEEACADKDIALWYAYACNNIAEYEFYYMTTQWMPASEVNAGGCGMWHYRYSVALMFCGRLEDALIYAKKATEEEPSYPWGWLQLAKLLSHFQDKKGAISAVKQGLKLVPNDYEFTVLRKEIKNNHRLDEMAYHYIDPESDKELKDGNLPDNLNKLVDVAGILVDEKALSRIKNLFNPINRQANNPYCSFDFILKNHELECIFAMNEAAMSKLNLRWICNHLIKITRNDYLYHTDIKLPYHKFVLQTIIFRRNYSAEFVYIEPKKHVHCTIIFYNNGQEETFYNEIH